MALVLSVAPCEAADDVIVSHFEVLKACKKISFLDKTVKELKTPQGQAILAAGAAMVGVDPKTVGVVAKAIPVDNQSTEQDTYPFIRSPEGYTICSARPSNLNTGSGQYGIETHGDTTFNSTVVRGGGTQKKDDGLWMYMVVPCKASTDTRVQSGFDVTFVKADPGWERKYPKCMPTGMHPWLARNNGTRLEVKP
jgi:hypothetical protein